MVCSEVTVTHKHTQSREHAMLSVGTQQCLCRWQALAWFPWALATDLHTSTMREKAKLLVTARSSMSLSATCSL